MTGNVPAPIGLLAGCRAAQRGSSGIPRKFRRALAVGAAVLGGAALVNVALARRAERRHPPEGKFLTVDGVRLHYIERGTGPVVVLLHGNGTMARDFVLSGLFDFVAKKSLGMGFDRA